MSISDSVMARLRERGLYDQAAKICLDRGVTLVDACGLSKSQSVMLARQALYRWLSTAYRYSSLEIGQLFNRDRSVISKVLRG